MTQIPAQVRGYVAMWNAVAGVGSNGFRTVFRPGSISINHYDITADCSHLAHTAFASTFDKSLRLFGDALGLAFEADIPLSVQGAAVRNMLNSGEPWGCSGSYFVEEEVLDGDIQTITRGRLLHVAVTATPACRSTSCWLPNENAFQPSRSVREHWAAGREAADRQAAADRDLLRNAPRLRDEFRASELQNQRLRAGARLIAAGRRAPLASNRWPPRAMTWPQVEEAARGLGLL
jgi:phage head maturation protease